MQTQFVFKGVHAPAELFDLVSEGEITGEQAWLLLTIDAYVKCKGDGCFASNETLGKNISRDKRHVQRMIQILRGYRNIDGKIQRVGPRLVRITGWKLLSNGKYLRILETKWSRIDNSDWESPEPIRGEKKDIHGIAAVCPPETHDISVPSTHDTHAVLSNKDKVEDSIKIIPNGTAVRQGRKPSIIDSPKFIGSIRTNGCSLGEEIWDWVRSVECKIRHDQKRKGLSKEEKYAFARMLNKLSEDLEDGSKRINTFISALDNGDANFGLLNAAQFRRCFDLWESRINEVTWKKMDGEDKPCWSQAAPPTAEQLDQCNWSP